MRIWLAAVDNALEEAQLENAQRLLRAIRAHRLSVRAQAEVELTRAKWYTKLDEHKDAIAAYRRAITLFRRLGDEHNEVLVSNSLALLLQKLGRYAEALIHYGVVAKSYRRLGNHDALGDILSNLEQIPIENIARHR